MVTSLDDMVGNQVLLYCNWSIHGDNQATDCHRVEKYKYVVRSEFILKPRGSLFQHPSR
jgi:hypothetical protein